MKILTKLGFVLALVMSAVLFTAPAHAEVDPDMRPALDQALNSTVHIRARGAVNAEGDYRNWTGTGYVVGVEDDRVIIATNCHVACNAVFLWVTSYDATLDDQRATFITGDDNQDIAFISVPRYNGARALELLDGSPNLGEASIALGGPLGLKFSVTEGIISRQNRTDLNYPTPDGVHQTDAAINPGNSGGPLLVERDGHYVVAGMNTFIVTRTGQNIGLGFAVPSTDVARALAAVQAGQTPTRNTLGIGLGEMNHDMSQLMGVPQFYQRQNVDGAYISFMLPNSPAATAGLQPMDILVEVGTTLIRSPEDVVRAVQSAPADRPIRALYVRAGGQKTTYVTPANSWASAMQTEVAESLTAVSTTPPTDPIAATFGFTLADPGSPAYLEKYAPHLNATGYRLIGSPLVVGLVNGQNAHEAGVTVGQFIVGIQFRGTQPIAVRSTADLAAAVAAAQRAGIDTSLVALHTQQFVQAPDGSVQLMASAVILHLN